MCKFKIRQFFQFRLAPAPDFDYAIQVRNVSHREIIIMEDKKIRLAALDLDGTLLNPEGKISKEDQETIRGAAEEGAYIVISTGRPYVGVPVQQLAPLGVRYAITTNGAAVYRMPEKECLYSDCLERSLACEIIRKLDQYRIHFDVFVDGDAFSQEKARSVIRRLGLPDSMKQYILDTRVFVEDVAAYIEENGADVQKITINFCPLEDGNYEDYEEVYRLLTTYPQITFLSGGFHNLEITKAGVGKGAGLRFLAKRLGMSLEETMACGDTPNDIDIMKTAGVAVAMGNAEKEVKEIADFITLTNRESGVAHALRKYILNS